jgi:nickel-type superoxide dismutase maturation protease
MHSRADYRFTLREALAWLTGRRKRFSVTGDSMLPLLEPGDDLLVDQRAVVEVGAVVVAEHPHTDIPIVKMVSAIDESRVTLVGLARSTDSHDFGALPRSSMIGVVQSIL